MAKQTINIGTAPNDGTGDLHRNAFSKVNDNFTELYDAVATIASQSITATADQTVFNFTNPVAGRTVFVNGMHQARTIDYTITGTNQITFAQGLLQHDVVTAEAKN